MKRRGKKEERKEEKEGGADVRNDGKLQGIKNRWGKAKITKNTRKERKEDKKKEHKDKIPEKRAKEDQGENLSPQKWRYEEGKRNRRNNELM